MWSVNHLNIHPLIVKSLEIPNTLSEASLSYKDTDFNHILIQFLTSINKK